MDCVTEDGNAVIAYLADLRWSKLSLRYQSLLSLRDREVCCRSSIRDCSLPSLHGDEITIDLPRVGLAGTWRSLGSAAKFTIFDGEAGSVIWHCLQPKSRVDLLLGKTERRAGLGYAECVTLSVLPWKLPIDVLHWGRFLTEYDALVWIDWRGPYQKQVILHNGKERHAKFVTDSELAWADDARLELDRGTVLRRGSLGQTVFPTMPSVAKLLPRSIMAVREDKWLSRGVLRTNNKTSSGWAIHEVVRWRD